VKEIVVLVPAYNEESTIAEVIAEIRSALPQAEVVVINDGSADRTGELARKARAVTIDLPFNLGIGAAMQTGYRYARAHGHSVAVQVDGDGQHVPAEIPRLLAPLAEGADLVIGSRFASGRTYRAPLSRRLGMLFFSRAVSLLTGKRFLDTTSGFRAANRKVIEFYSRHYPSDYPEPEAILLLSRAGFRVTEVPAVIRERGGGHSSITLLRGLYYMVKVSLALFMGRVRRPPRLEEE